MKHGSHMIELYLLVIIKSISINIGDPLPNTGPKPNFVVLPAQNALMVLNS